MRKKEKKTDAAPVPNGRTTGESEYKVGPKHPPRECQFKPGNPGGPGGVSAGHKIIYALKQGLDKTAGTDAEGKVYSYLEAIIMSLLQGAAKGTARMIELILERLLGRTPMAVELTPDGAATYAERIAAVITRMDEQKAKPTEAQERKTDGPGTPPAPGPDAGKA